MTKSVIVLCVENEVLPGFRTFYRELTLLCKSMWSFTILRKRKRV